MELYNILRSLTVDELKIVKKISTELIKEKQPKKVIKTRDSKIQDVKDKLDMGTYNLNYHELMYAFEIISRRHGYPVTINVRDEVAFIKRAFGDKPKDGFGKFEVDVLTRYITSYENLYKSETYPYPTLKGLGQSWIINKIKNLVEIENSKSEISELSKEVF